MHPYGGVAAAACRSGRGQRRSARTRRRASRSTSPSWDPTAVPNQPPATAVDRGRTGREHLQLHHVGRSTGYVATVTVFNYRDYGPNAFYGIERWENPAGPNGSKKPAYTALREAARGEPLNLAP